MAQDGIDARKAYDELVAKWTPLAPAVVRSLEEAGNQLLTFYEFPRAMWKSIRTTNALENLNREFRRRTKTQASFSSEESAVALLFGLIASGQIQLRRIDGYQRLSEVLEHAQVAARSDTLMTESRCAILFPRTSEHILHGWGLANSAMQSKAQILDEFSLFSVPTGGIGSWLTEDTHDDVFARLGKIDEEPLPAVQLNQLLVLAHEAPVSDGFFRYYWLQVPDQHCYDVRDLPGYSEDFLSSDSSVTSLAHLKWGLYRLYVDALLFFGNVRSAFRSLRDLPISDIEAFFEAERLDTAAIKQRMGLIRFRRRFS